MQRNEEDSTEKMRRSMTHWGRRSEKLCHRECKHVHSRTPRHQSQALIHASDKLGLQYANGSWWIWVLSRHVSAPWIRGIVDLNPKEIRRQHQGNGRNWNRREQKRRERKKEEEEEEEEEERNMKNKMEETAAEKNESTRGFSDISDNNQTIRKSRRTMKQSTTHTLRLVGRWNEKKKKKKKILGPWAISYKYSHIICIIHKNQQIANLHTYKQRSEGYHKYSDITKLKESS